MSPTLEKSTRHQVHLGEVVRHVTDRVNAETSGLTRFLAGEHIPSGSLSIHTWGEIGRDPMGPMFYKRFTPGHVLYVSRRTYLRKVAVPHFEGITGEKTFVLETTNPSVLLQEFLPFVLSTERFHKYAISNSRGSVNPYLNWGELAAYKFDLPPLDEQQRIADLLWAVERHRLSLASPSLRRLHDDMLRELLTVHAPKRPVAAVGTVVMGRQRAPKYAEGPNMVPYLRVANVGDDILRLDDVKQMNFTPAEQARYSVEPDDILVSEGQSRELVGQSVLVAELPEPMCFQNTLIRFRPNKDLVRPRYAQSLFRACLKSGVFADLSRQTTSIAHLGAQRFAQLELPWPSLEDQDKALDRHHAVLVALEAVSQEIARLQDLRTAILADTFEGVDVHVQ